MMFVLMIVLCVVMFFYVVRAGANVQKMKKKLANQEENRKRRENEIVKKYEQKEAIADKVHIEIVSKKNSKIKELEKQVLTRDREIFKLKQELEGCQTALQEERRKKQIEQQWRQSEKIIN